MRDEPQQQRGELAHAGAGGARGGEHRHLRAQPLLPLGDGGAHALLGHEVGLRQRQHPRQTREALVVGGELALDRRVVGDRIRLRAHRQLGCEVEHVHEQTRALDVREEVVAEAGAIARAFDQAGDVGDDQLALLALEHAEHRRERRERVVGDLRRGASEPREQRGLASVRQPDETDVGEQLQPQLEPALLPGESALGETRRLARGRGEVLVALAAAAAASDPRVLPRREQLPAAAEQVRLLSPAPGLMLIPCAAVRVELVAARGGDSGDLRPGWDPERELSPSAPWRWEPAPWPPRPAR